jgi:predicted PurR-regulated permease PerM
MSEFKIPPYAKFSVIIVGALACIAMMYYGQALIVPLIFAGLIAIVLHPLESIFQRLHFNRLISIILTITISILLVSGLALFIILQVSKFTSSMPILFDRLETLVTDVILKVSGIFDISAMKATSWITSLKETTFDNTGPAIGKTLITLGNAFVVILLVPVYTFMIMYYEPLLLEFVKRSFHTEHREKVSKVISDVKILIQSYLSGLFIEMLIVAGLDSTALLVLGVDYAILLCIIAAILNVIPYLGGIVGALIPMMIALATKDSPWVAVWVMVLFYIIQLIDNNYIVPKIVASKVKINALVSVFVVLAFGALWGIPGMFISIPLTAIIKLISDHIDKLKPFGFLLGDTMPLRHPFSRKPIAEDLPELEKKAEAAIRDKLDQL